MLHRVLICLVISTMLSFCKSPQKERGANIKPNVIVILTDDQGYADLSSFGATAYQTPHIDQLASEGIRFTDFYVPATVCTPSRAALMTGSYPKRVGLHESVLRPYSTTGLSPDEYTMAEMFADAGYRTACMGKWHLGHYEEFMPNRQGFDHFFGVPYSNDMDSYFYQNLNFQSPPLPLYENSVQIESSPDQRHLTRRFTDAAIEFIKKEEKPFFVYLAHIMPHIPLHVSEEFEGKTSYGVYGDVIAEIDWNVGRLISFLKEEGLYDNTIIVYTSDNGPHEDVNAGSANPLRGWKTQTWEGGQRVPGIITWPAQIPTNVVSDQLVTTLDMMPTFASIVGASLPADRTLDGRDIVSLLKNPKGTRLTDTPFFYYALNGDVEAVRLGKWKLHVAKSKGHDEEDVFPVSLFDLENDISEQENVADQNPEIVKKLQVHIAKFDKHLTENARPVGEIADYKKVN